MDAAIVEVAENSIRISDPARTITLNLTLNAVSDSAACSTAAASHSAPSLSSLESPGTGLPIGTA